MVFTENVHVPVLLAELLEELNVVQDELYIDATVGGGGYTRAILEKGGRVLGIDADQDALNLVSRNVKDEGGLILQKGNFRDIKIIAKKHGFEHVAGVVFDLGMSSNQLQQGGRGFSFQSDEPLDLRYDKAQQQNGATIINKYSKEELYEIFSHYAEELNSRSIAEAIVRARRLIGEIKTTSQLRKIISDQLQQEFGQLSQHIKEERIRGTLARIFQALRIEVNSELDTLDMGMNDAIELLGQGGKVCIVSFHSLEDRIIKRKLKHFEMKNLIKIVHHKPITASYGEIRGNSRSRSAKLRIGIKV